ncbi:MAG: hypothetical protein H6684_13945 [Deltaproteobacteria bacterium]|nr:hypothetical protein [Deltaproteobacteria bacterium]MCB9478639.1 hypothetical protein [Deltaproteobacteria bacterium]MCB9489830.1 hypothetical protein [Deltaproteobacteria bacterium]
MASHEAHSHERLDNDPTHDAALVDDLIAGDLAAEDLPGDDAHRFAFWLRVVAVFIAVMVLMLVVQFFMFHIGVADGKLKASTAQTSIHLNLALVVYCVAMAGGVYYWWRFKSESFDANRPRIFSFVAHLTTIVLLAAWVTHIHFAGSQNTLLLMIIPATIVATGLALGFTWGWIYYALGNAVYLAVLYFEVQGTLTYAPLFKVADEIRPYFTDPRYVAVNVSIYFFISCFTVAVIQFYERQRLRRNVQLASAVRVLEHTIDEIKRLQGLLPMCSVCNKIRDDEGYWIEVSRYIQSQTDAKVSHGICPECMSKMYPEYADRTDGENSGGSPVEQT